MEQKRILKLSVVILALVLSLMIWFIANSIVPSQSYQTEQNKAGEVTKNKDKSWNVAFGDKIKSNDTFDFMDTEEKIKAFVEYYKLELSSIEVTNIEKYSTGLFLTNKMDGHQFVINPVGTVSGFITEKEMSSKSKEVVQKSFSNFNLTENKTLYIGALTNGLLYKDGKSPLIAVKDLETVEANYKVQPQSLSNQWGELKAIVDSSELVFKRFVKSPTGVYLAEYSINDTDKVYYSLYTSRDESEKEMILGEFVGYRKQSYDQEITNLFVENMSQFGIFRVGENDILWIRY